MTDDKVKEIADYMYTKGGSTLRIAHVFGITPKEALACYKQYYTGSYAAIAKERREERLRAARAYGLKHKDMRPRELAQLFDLSVKAVYKLDVGWRPRKKPDADEFEKIKDLIKARPMDTIRGYSAATGRSLNLIRHVIGVMLAEGYDHYERQHQIVKRFFVINRKATVEDAAAHFGCSRSFILSALHRYYDKGQGESDDNDVIEFTAVAPPPDIASEIELRGGFGVELPPDAMRRFCELHRRKKDEWERTYRERYV